MLFGALFGLLGVTILSPRRSRHSGRDWIPGPVCPRETPPVLQERVCNLIQVRHLHFIYSKFHSIKKTHSFSRSASSRTLDLSHVTPAFWQLEHVGYSLSHYIIMIRFGVLAQSLDMGVLFVFSFCSGYTPFSRVCGDCSPSTPDCSVWKTPGCVQARTFSRMILKSCSRAHHVTVRGSPSGVNTREECRGESLSGRCQECQDICMLPSFYHYKNYLSIYGVLCWNFHNVV